MGDTTLAGLEYLEGKTVQIKGDGSVFNPKIVKNGQITLEEPVVTAEVGLEYNPFFETLPINLPPSEGDTTYAKKRVYKIFLDLYESNGIYVNGTEIPQYNIDSGDPISLSPKTEIVSISPKLDAQLKPTIVITQKNPLQFTLRGIGYEFEVTR